jgi:gamma-glutamyl hercynylcysteine S-oxide synthase
MDSRTKTRSAKQPDADTVKDTVKLGPLFGFSPHRYIPVLYLSAAVLVLFAVFIVPGIVRHGSRVSFASDPVGAEIYLNGTRRGSTPLEIFLPAGNYRVEYRMPGIDPQATEINVSGRVFGSLFFPRQLVHYSHLPLEDAQLNLVLSSAVRDYAGWAAVGKSSTHHRFPPVLSQGMDLLMTAAPVPVGSKRIDTGREVLMQSVAHTVAPSLLRDYVRAAALLHTAGAAVGPGGIIATVQFFAHLHNDAEALPVLLSEALPRPEAERLNAAPGFRNFVEQKSTALVALSYEELPTELLNERRTLLGTSFVQVPAGRVALGQSRQGREPSNLELPWSKEVPSFEIMEHVVTRSEYSAFLDENPMWGPDNTEELIDAGYVTQDYLRDWSDDMNPALPVTFVSYYAAEAYAEWFDRRVSNAYPAWQVRLPREAEFEWATVLDGSDLFPGNFRERQNAGPRPAAQGEQGNLGLYHMQGNVWEWQRDYFAPASYLMGDAVESAGIERVVRGGAWVNSSNEVEPSTRGAQHPAWCSPFLGFRLVVVPGERG